MHVHAADDHAPRAALHFARDVGVTLLVGVRRAIHGRARTDAWTRRWARCRSSAATSHTLRRRAASSRRMDATERAHRGLHLELRAQEFRADAPVGFGDAALQQFGGRIGNQVARGQIHEQIFFFHPQRERWLNVPRRRHDAEYYTSCVSPSVSRQENLVDGAGFGQMEALDVVDADLLEHRPAPRRSPPSRRWSPPAWRGRSWRWPRPCCDPRHRWPRARRTARRSSGNRPAGS